mmetsp:Transcript_7477/g.19301  ORF Transcript_7477/g.19301 Transcript_7477/m.19301 type:complete len:555 (-) Transcript_7477:31-1695(-)
MVLQSPGVNTGKELNTPLLVRPNTSSTSAGAVELGTADDMTDVGEEMPATRLTESFNENNGKEFRKPDKKIALRAANSMLLKDDNGDKISMRAGFRKLTKLGQGPLVYLSLLWYLCFFMGAMSASSIPIIVMNFQANTSRLKIFFANECSDISIFQQLVLWSSLGNRKGEASFAQGIFSIIILVIIVIFCIVFRRVQAHVEEENAVRVITAQDYTVHIRGLPRRVIDPDELEAFFGRFGEVALVSVVQNKYSEFRAKKRRKEVAEQLEIEKVRIIYASGKQDPKLKMKAKNRVEKLTYQLEKIDTSISKLEASARTEEGQACCGQAFVTFNEVAAAKETLEYYEKRTWYEALWCCWSDPLKEKLLFDGRPILVERAHDSTDVIWEHLPFHFGARLVRQMANLVLCIFLILIASLLITLVSGKQWFSFNLASNGNMYGLLIAQMAVIIGANIFLFFIIPTLMPFERHHHKSTVETRMMKMLFSFQVLNTITQTAVLWNFLKPTEEELQCRAGEVDYWWKQWYGFGGYTAISAQRIGCSSLGITLDLCLIYPCVVF